MGDSSKVTTGKPKVTGAVFVAPLGTVVPTDATSSLSSAYKDLGYISDAGITNSNSPTTTEIKAWGGDVVDNPTTDRPDNWKFSMIEALNVNVLKMVYGDGNVTGDIDNGITITSNSEELESHVIVIDEILKGNVLSRTVLPNAKVTAIADIVHTDGSVIGYDTTLSCQPDDAGNKHYSYIVQSTESL